MNFLERTLVLGGGGQLGTDLVRVFREGGTVLVPDRRSADLTQPESLRAMLVRYRPTLVINTAAYHNVEQCEIYPDRAFATNAIGVDALAGLCALAGIAFAHISTDYVFDGTLGRAYREDDAPNPLNAYGISKYAGERLVPRHGERHFIFRTSGLYGRAGSSTKGYTFIERVVGQAQRGEPVRVVDDMTFSPSYTLHVAELIRRIIERGSFGIYHVTNAGSCSWYEFAHAAFDLLGLRNEIERVTYAAFDTSIKRPLHSELEHARVAELGIEDAPPWRDGLAAYFGDRLARETVRA